MAYPQHQGQATAATPSRLSSHIMELRQSSGRLDILTATLTNFCDRMEGPRPPSPRADTKEANLVSAAEPPINQGLDRATASLLERLNSLEETVSRLQELNL